MIGSFVVLFTVILHHRIGHSVDDVSDEEAGLQAARPLSDVLGAVQVFFKRTAIFQKVSL